jgi:hypothetical protein
MASRLLLHRPLRPFTLAALFTSSGFLLTRSFTFRKPLQCDSLAERSFPFNNVPASGPVVSTPERKSVPLFKDGSLNPEAMKQISSGSLIGLVCGIGVSVFSKPLALLIGLLIGGVYVRD